ncbi:hypothetical protein [Effusibacillus lacus]|uniref:Uncharacterized protein n=1 Tax=Effusibacillus lacus TaxID=1348429 RepID=A0A292YJG7_9BACL|nr:hypothetical protein [Effusibacillus lacus]TCS69510.1 hypothetical protein EDD64_13627 [Effusibacillus lacus]GAX90078.1 hypothetical protein EFBL_1704 [Effusibacillus lacus]
MGKHVVGQFQDNDQALRAIYKLKPMFENRITVVKKAPGEQDRDLGEVTDGLTDGIPIAQGIIMNTATGAGVTGNPVSGYGKDQGADNYLEAANESHLREEANNEREAIMARYSSTLVIVETTDADREEAKRILEENGATLISLAKAGALGNDDPFVTADPIEPFSPRGYIDPNIGLGNYGIVDPLKDE